MSRAPRRLVLRAAVSLAAIGLLLPSLPGTAQAASPGKNGRIAFEERGSIYTITAAGAGVKKLTAGPSDHTPRWSPNGKTIAFERSGDLWLMQADGSDQRQLTSGPGYDTEPGWSPDGTQVVFVRSDDGSYAGRSMFVKPVAGGLPNRLTSADDGCAVGPTWTADNRYVVFSTECGAGGRGVHKVNRATGVITDVVPATGLAGPGGQWHFGGTTTDVTPDSRYVVFTVDDPGENAAYIGICDLSGGNFRRIAGFAEQGVFAQDDPSVSPDGKLVAYSIGNENPRIATAKIARSDQTATDLYGDGFYVLHFDWQPKS